MTMTCCRSPRSFLLPLLLLLSIPSCIAAECLDSECIHGSCHEGACQCEPNFTGPDCSLPYQLCEDGDRTCYNGSVCVRNDKRDPVTQKYGYHCDCTEAFGVSAFAGLQCENAATSSCEIDNDTPEFAFCTNQGTCRKMVKRGEPHPGCTCADDFEGMHCQYLKGTAPPEDLVQYPGDDGEMSAVAKFVIVIVSLGVAGLLGYVIWKKKSVGKDKQNVEISNVEGDLQLQESSEEPSNAEII